MIQVKMIRNEAKLIERDINDFLRQIGSMRGTKIELRDIKLYHIAERDIDTALIIYNQMVVPPNSGSVTEDKRLKKPEGGKPV